MGEAIRPGLNTEAVRDMDSFGGDGHDVRKFGHKILVQNHRVHGKLLIGASNGDRELDIEGLVCTC